MASASNAPSVSVRVAGRADVDELAAVLGRAFHDDPVWEFVVAARPLAARVEQVMRVYALTHLDEGLVFVATDDDTGAILGAAVWAAPGHWKTPMSTYVRHAPTLLRGVGLRGIAKISVLSALEREHPTEPHYYLAMLGTDPAHQGRGVGSALIAPVLERCEAEGLPAYLESSKESNVPFYARHRFAVTKPFTLKGGPTMYFMWRPAE